MASKHPPNSTTSPSNNNWQRSTTQPSTYRTKLRQLQVGEPIKNLAIYHRLTFDINISFVSIAQIKIMCLVIIIIDAILLSIPYKKFRGWGVVGETEDLGTIAWGEFAEGEGELGWDEEKSRGEVEAI